MRNRIADTSDIYGSDYMQKVRERIRSKIEQIRAELKMEEVKDELRRFNKKLHKK
jgi:hypothetical protein